ncbi:MAG: hypothetical protein H8E16_12915 [Flavobacteriales bacterium]|nr:hypothetical protein [Flavobacteriales bacterium]
MKHIKAINEAVGTIIERRASAESLLKAVVNGDTTEVEGIKLSKQMAQGFLDWLQFSTYGKKFGALPFYKLFSASFNWGLDRFVKGANTEVKGEFKELKAKAKSMKEAKELNESSAKDVLKDAINALTKTLSSKKLDKSYVKDYLKSIETMARKKPGDFVKDYSNFSNADWIEDVEYNFANESVTEGNRYSVEYSDGIRSSKEFRNESDAIKHAKELSKDKSIQFVSVHKPGMHSTASKEDLIAWYGKGSYWDNVSKKDKEVAELQLENLAVNEAVTNGMNEAFKFSEKEVKDIAELIAKAIAKMDKSKTAVHDMEYDAGRGAGFEISMDGEKYDGGSYVVRPNGEVYNAAIGNSFPNAVYAKIGDTDIRKVMKNIKKFESVDEAKNSFPFKGRVEDLESQIGNKYYIETTDDEDTYNVMDSKTKKFVGNFHYDGKTVTLLDMPNGIMESVVNEAKFVKSYDTKVNDAETEKEVLKIYPKAKFFVGKISHFFGELEPNLFFKAYYPKYYKQDTGKSIKGDFKITSVYSKKGSNYVELMESFKSYSKFVSENYDTEQRKEMAAKGFALSDGSFPIANLEDLKNAIQAYGRAKDQAKAAKFIVKRAKALGAEDLVPDTDDFQKSLDEVYTQVPAETIAVTEGTDIGSWNQGGLKGKENVLITTFVGPKDIEDFGLGRKCMQINVGMKYVSLNPADIVELKDILKSYKVK